MRDIIFSETGWRQYIEWQSEDKKTLKKINDLLKDIQRNGLLKGIGKPELLKNRKACSRRIDDHNRLVCECDEKGTLRVISCKGHYDE
jgi:toxin YoeB